jgi:outer membrane autotransporter protein
MKPVELNHIVRRIAAALLVTSYVAVDRAEAACTPPTSTATPANNTTVTCTGTTTDQNADNVTTFNGYGTGIETGIVVNVEAGASVTASSSTPQTSGINVRDGTVNNLGTVTVAGVNGTGIFGFGSITVNNSGSINFDTAGHGDRGIQANGGTATVTNNVGGHIFGNLAGVDGQTVNVTNSDLIEAGDPNGIAIHANNTATVNNLTGGVVRANGQNGVAIEGHDVIVTGNAGTIEAGIGAGITGGVAIKADAAGGTADVTTSGAIQASLIAILTDGLLTLNNTGSIVSGGDVLKSLNGAVNVTNSGTIATTGAGATAISTDDSDVTLNNSGIIQAIHRAIEGGNVSITNTGTIAVNGVAGSVANAILATVLNLDNSGSIFVTGPGALGAVHATSGNSTIKNSGTIVSNVDNSFAIKSDSGALDVNNLSGGLIQANGANGVAINAGTNATVANAGRIEAAGAGGIAIQAVNGTATVSNIGDGITTGIITADKSAIFANAVTVTGNSGLIEATAANANAVAISAAATATVNNLIGGVVRANGARGIAVNSDGTADITNFGRIEADDFAVKSVTDAKVDNAGIIKATGIAIIAGATATVSNTGDGITTGIISGGVEAIHGGTVNVTANTGTIEATLAQGVGISAGFATVANGAGGTISGGAFGIRANTVNVTANAGTIKARGARAGAAILALGDANVNNSGVIEANGDQNIAVAASFNANITNVGTFQATGAGGIGIFAGVTAAVNNLTGGTITGGGFGIRAGTLDVTNALGATISGGSVGIEGSGTVRNAGKISGGTRSVNFTGFGPNTLILQTGSVLIGDAVGSAVAGATNKLILQGSGTADNHFTGFNTLDVEASGAWVWNSNSAIDATTVKSGTLVVDNVLASPITVNAGGTLAGQGNISGGVLVASGGVVAPGAAVPFSTLNANGDVSFQPGSVFRVNANAAGQNDKLAVTGSATLTGGTVNVLAGGSFAPSSSTAYKILTTTTFNGLGDTRFASVTTNLAFLTPSLSYTANDVSLTLETAAGGTGDPGPGDPGGGGTGGGGTGGGGFGFARVAQTRNQAAVATALDRGPVSNPLIIAVLNQSVAGARQAFDALSGEVFASVHNAQGQEAQFARSAMLSRMRQGSYAGIPGELGALGFGGPALAYAAGDTSSANNASAAYATKAATGARGPSRDLTFWAQGLGGWGHADSDGNAASLKSRFGGFLSGVDARFGDTWRAGFVAGYMRSDLNVNARASSAGIDSVQIGAYAAGRLGAFNVRSGASYSLDSIDTSRTIFFPGFTDKASARFHGNVGQVFGEVGYGMAFGSVAVEPLAGLAYVHVRDGSFLESGGVAALSGASANENTGYSFVGVRAATFVPLANGTVLIPRGMLQWQHAFGDVVPASALAFQGTGAAFSVAGIPIARNTALVEGGFDWRFAPQAKLGAFYQGELAAHAQTHAFKGAFTWDF